ncbi:MAG: hypothetical protein ACI8QC_004240 [Planctomycetota bacterium]|jgi:hypothetical protein
MSLLPSKTGRSSKRWGLILWALLLMGAGAAQGAWAAQTAPTADLTTDGCGCCVELEEATSSSCCCGCGAQITETEGSDCTCSLSPRPKRPHAPLAPVPSAPQGPEPAPAASSQCAPQNIRAEAARRAPSLLLGAAQGRHGPPRAYPRAAKARAKVAVWRL